MSDIEQTNPLVEQLLQEAQELDFSLTQDQACSLVQHLELVIEKNKVMNLTRIVDEQDAVTKHLVDSLLFTMVAQEQDLPQGEYLDIGTGAGFPGIPFAITSGREGVLLDSVGKKVKAVQEFLTQLGLSHTVHAESDRVEAFAKEHPSEFVLVVARAVAQTNVLVEYAAPLLAKGGFLIISKGNISDDELQDGQYAARVCGMEYVSRETFELPRDAGHRELLVFKKVKKPSIALPRKVGDAKHNPLCR